MILEPKDMASNSDPFSVASDDAHNENSKHRMRDWVRGVQDNFDNVPTDELKEHLDLIFTSDVPESLLTFQQKREKIEHGAEFVDTLTAQMREIHYVEEQMEAHVQENQSLHTQIEKKEQELSQARKELAEVRKICSDLRLQSVVIQEQLKARSKSEEMLQSQADAIRDDLAQERR
jgi:hypothetical protein